MKRGVLAVLTMVTVLGCSKTSDKAPPNPPAPTSEATPVDRAAPAPPAATAADPWKAQPTQKDPLAKPFLWSIEKDGRTSYALGTIHLGVDAETRLPQVVWDKIDALPALAVETDLADPTLQDVIKCVGCSLRRDLGQGDWNKLESIVGPRIAATLDSMKPMAAATLLSVQALPQTASMDSVLLARAQTRNKRLVYLEHAKDAARVLEKWMDVRALKMLLSDYELVKSQTAQLLDAYVRGDDAAMLALSDKDRERSLAHGYTKADLDEQQRDMLYARNAAWIPAIEAMHAGGGGFVAVGALHLIGPKSVLEMLAAKGYKIARIP